MLNNFEYKIDDLELDISFNIKSVELDDNSKDKYFKLKYESEIFNKDKSFKYFHENTIYPMFDELVLDDLNLYEKDSIEKLYKQTAYLVGQNLIKMINNKTDGFNDAYIKYLFKNKETKIS